VLGDHLKQETPEEIPPGRRPSLTRRTLLTGAATVAAKIGTVSAAPLNSDPLAWTLTEAAGAVAKRMVSSEELTKLCLARIAKLDPQLNAFITVTADSALAQARKCDRERSGGRLHGVPIALKTTSIPPESRLQRQRTYSATGFPPKMRKSRDA